MSRVFFFFILVFASEWALLAASARAQAPSCSSSVGQGQNFRGQNLVDRNFSAQASGSLVGADFSGASLKGAVFAGQDLTNANFSNADLGPSANGSVDFTNTTLTKTCFIGASLDQTDFTYSSITCADFSGTSLVKATFGPIQSIVASPDGCRTKFVAATLDIGLITSDPSGKSNWGKVDFSNAVFMNFDPTAFNLRGQDITGAILVGVKLPKLDMTGANLTNVDFSKAVLTGAKFDNAALNGAVLFNVQAQSATFTCAQGYGSGAQRKRADGTDCPAAPVSTNPAAGVNLALASLAFANLTGATLDHAVLSSANLSPATLDNASFVAANFEAGQDPGTGTKLGAAIVASASFQNADFSTSKLSQVDFSGSNLTGAKFDKTTLSGTSFSNATMPNASFQNSTLQGVNFSQAILQSAQFQKSVMQSSGSASGVNFRCAQLGGSSFDSATIGQTSFNQAVMPAAADCCPATVAGGTAFCGTVNATQQVYGPVTFPILTDATNICPDGSTGQCRGSNWKLSSNWQSTACSFNGQSVQMWSRPNCGGHTGDIVEIPDPNLKDCILKAYPGQNDILLSTAEQIGEVSCPNRGIVDITGLEQFSNLHKLDLSANALTIFTLNFVGADGKPLKTSPLTSLYLDYNCLITLDLTKHQSLVNLSASFNQLKSISLSANAYLVNVNVSNNQLGTFDLASQTALALADLSRNSLKDVLLGSADLSQLTSLVSLDLSYNNLSTIGSLNGIASSRTNNASLLSAFMSCNPTFQCSTLGVKDGNQFPLATTTSCSAYDATTKQWSFRVAPTCPSQP